MVSMMLLWLFVVLASHMSQSLDADGFNSFILEEKMTIYRLNEYGVPVTGKNSVSIRIKSCKGIAVAFMKFYKDDNNRYISMWVSVDGVTNVYDCVNNPPGSCSQKPAKSVTGDIWQCPNATDLWIKWTLTGYASLGTGLIPGKDMVVEYQGVKKENPVNYIGVVLLKETNVVIKVASVEPVVLEPPSAYLRVKEDTKEGTALYTIKGQKATYQYSLTDPKQTQFALSKDVISLKSKLDYEKRSNHHITVQVKDARSLANFSLYVDVINVFDEPPKVTLKQSATIPEELPIGTVVGKLFDITDADDGDNYTCALTGDSAKYLDIDANTCSVKIKARIDRDGAQGIKKLEKLKLTVTDQGKQQTSQIFDVAIAPINDNPPQFENPLYVIQVKPKRTDQSLGKVTAKDIDAEGKKMFDVDMSIKSGNDDGIFTLSNNELTCDLKKLMDRKILEKVKGSYSLLVEAKDKPTSGVPLAATTVVVVKVSSVEELVLSGKEKDNAANANKFSPQWAKPKPRGTSFKSVSVQEDVKPGTVIWTVKATDQDSGLAGRVIYGFNPRKPRKGKPPDNSTLYLKMDALTGDLRVAMPLNCDKKLGGVTNFKIDVYAKDSATDAKEIKALLRVSIKNVNDNPPAFNQSMYEASYACKHNPKIPILNFMVVDYDAKTRLKLPLLSGEGSEYYNVYKKGRYYAIQLKSGVQRDQTKDAVDVISMTATDELFNTTVVAIIRFKSCAPKPTTWEPTTAKNIITTEQTTPTTTQVVTTTTPEPTTPTTVSTTTTRATTTTFISTTGEVFVTLCTTVKRETVPPTTPTTTTTTTTTTTPSTTTVTSTTTTSTTTTTTTTTLPTTPKRTFPPTSPVPCCSCSELDRVKSLYQEQMDNADNEEIKGNNSATGWAIKATCIVLSACLLCGAVVFIAKKYGFGRNQRQADKKPPENSNRIPPGPAGQGPKKSDDHIDLEANRGGPTRGRGVAPDVLPSNPKALPPRNTSQSPSALTDDETKMHGSVKPNEDVVSRKESHIKKNDENIRKNSKGSGCKAGEVHAKESAKAKPDDPVEADDNAKGDNSEAAEKDAAEKANVLNKMKGNKKSSSVEAAVLGIMTPSEKKKLDSASDEKNPETNQEKGGGDTAEGESVKTTDKVSRKKSIKGKGTGLLGVIQMKVEKDKAIPDATNDKGNSDGDSKTGDKEDVTSRNTTENTKIENEPKDMTNDATESITMSNTATVISSTDTKTDENGTSTTETKKKSKSLAKSKSRALSKAKTLGKMGKSGEMDEDGKSKQKKAKTQLTSPIEDLPTPTKKKIPELPDSAKKRCPDLQDEPLRSPIPDLPDSVKTKPQWENPKQDPMKNRVQEFPDEIPTRPQWVAPSMVPMPHTNALNPDNLPASNRPAWNDPKMDPMKDLPDALAMRSMALIQQTSRERPGSTYSESAESYANGKERRDSITSTTKSLPPLALGEGGKERSKRNRRNLTAS